MGGDIVKLILLVVFIVLGSLSMYLFITLSDNEEIIDYSILYEDYSEYNQSFENDDLRIDLFSASDDASEYLIYNIELFEDKEYTVILSCNSSINAGYRLDVIKVTQKGSYPIKLDINECENEFIYFMLAYKNADELNNIMIINKSFFKTSFDNN